MHMHMHHAPCSSLQDALKVQQGLPHPLIHLIQEKGGKGMPWQGIVMVRACWAGGRGGGCSIAREDSGTANPTEGGSGGTAN